MSDIKKEQSIGENTAWEHAGLSEMDITGIKGEMSFFDRLFYCEFDEDDAKAFVYLFERLKDDYTADAVRRFGDDLDLQIDSMQQKNACPIELMLYASRHVNGMLAPDAKVYKLLRKTLANLLMNKAYAAEAPTIIRYILGGWEWDKQEKLLIDAIRLSQNKTLIEIAMQYFNRFGRDNNRKETEILLLYLLMVMAGQDSQAEDNIVKVVSSSAFQSDKELVQRYLDLLSADPYWKNYALEINRKILGKVQNETIKYWIDRQEKKSITPNIAKNDNYDEWDFADRRTLNFCKNARGQNKEICEQIIENFKEIPYKLRSEYCLVLGAKGRACEENVSTFLSDICSYPEIRFPAELALCCLKAMRYEEAFDILFSNPDDVDDFTRESWAVNLGKHARYAVDLMSKEFIPYCHQYFVQSDKSVNLKSNIEIVLRVIRAYNDPGNKIVGNTSYPIVDDLLELLGIMADTIKNAGLNDYGAVVTVLKMILSCGGAAINGGVTFLAKLKQDLYEENISLDISNEIDRLLKEYDRPDNPSLC